MDIIERSQAIDDLVARGQLRHGLTDVGDLVEYAHLGMTIDPRFDELPVAVSAINAYELSLRSQDANDDASVIDELRAVSDEQWVRALREAPMEAQHDD